jgi:hypothetical protein
MSRVSSEQLQRVGEQVITFIKEHPIAILNGIASIIFLSLFLAILSKAGMDVCTPKADYGILNPLFNLFKSKNNDEKK